MSGSNTFPQGLDGRMDGAAARAGDGPVLSREDAAAVDAWVESGYEVGRVGAEVRARAERVVALLETLRANGGLRADRSLEDVVMLRVARMRRHDGELNGWGGGGGTDTGRLSPQDEAALDALVTAGFDIERVPSPQRDRGRRLGSLLALLKGPTPAPRQPMAGGDLVERTLARVQESVDREQARLAIDAGAGGRARGWQLGDLISVAAMLLIGTAVLWPMVAGARESNRRMACRSSMMAAGIGFGQYAGDFRDSLPLASASPAGGRWCGVGERAEESNSANLYVLVRMRYTGMDDLACAGNGQACRGEPKPGAVDWGCVDEVSYSYQNLFAVERPRWKGEGAGWRAVVVVDRSPVVRRALRGGVIYPLENSWSHGGEGQNVLFNDGSVSWLTTPVLENGDNIWLPRVLEAVIARLTSPTEAAPLNGTESPEAADDAFVGP